MNASTPPSKRASACSRYAFLRLSKLNVSQPGCVVSEDIEHVLLVGPIEPATKRGLSGVFEVYSSAISLAILHAARFISLHISSKR